MYTLVVHPDNTFSIRINDVEATKGSLLEDFTPSVNPPKEIDDPEDKKPADWVDEAQYAWDAHRMIDGDIMRDIRSLLFFSGSRMWMR